MSTHKHLFEGRRLARPQDDIEDQGLTFDIQTVLSRRRMLGMLGIGAGSLAMAGCSPSAEEASSSTASSDVAKLATETAGPYPGDGSNGPDVLEESGIERRDLTRSIDGNGTADGVPMTLTMNLTDVSNANAPLADAAVYIWHCNSEGQYSMYSDGVADQTWLRGVQVTDSNGQVTFTSIVPGCYEGRWPHIHFEVFCSIKDISDATTNVLTSQIALPEEMAQEVYKNSRYVGSADNLAGGSLSSDMVFSDGWDKQLPAMTGDASRGYTLSIDVPVDPTTTSSSADAGRMPGGPGPGPQGEPPAGPPPTDR